MLLPVEFLFQPREVEGSRAAFAERQLGTPRRMRPCQGGHTPGSPSGRIQINHRTDSCEPLFQGAGDRAANHQDPSLQNSLHKQTLASM